jgi:hypothetical protein
MSPYKAEVASLDEEEELSSEAKPLNTSSRAMSGPVARKNLMEEPDMLTSIRSCGTTGCS